MKLFDELLTHLSEGDNVFTVRRGAMFNHRMVIMNISKNNDKRLVELDDNRVAVEGPNVAVTCNNFEEAKKLFEGIW